MSILQYVNSIQIPNTMWLMERPLNSSQGLDQQSNWESEITWSHSLSKGGCPLEQYFCCNFLASRTSPMTGLLRASTMIPHVGLSLVVNHVTMTSLSWSPGLVYWTLNRSKLPTSTRSWMPRLYHLARHGKSSLRTVARSAVPKGGPEMVMWGRSINFKLFTSITQRTLKHKQVGESGWR